MNEDGVLEGINGCQRFEIERRREERGLGSNDGVLNIRDREKKRFC